jgi:hypothetical protein
LFAHLKFHALFSVLQKKKKKDLISTVDLFVWQLLLTMYGTQMVKLIAVFEGGRHGSNTHEEH